LILAGAFDGLGATRSSLMAIYPTIVKVVYGEKKATDAGQISMFGSAGIITDNVIIEIPDIAEFDEFTKLKLEKEVVGIYLSGHPLAQYAGLFEEFSFDTSKIKRQEEAEEEETVMDADTEETETRSFNNKQVVFGAIVSDVKKMFTKATKKEMAVLRVEDLYGAADVMLFPNLYDKVKNLAVKDAVVRISGKISVRDGEEPTVLADGITLLAGATVQSAQNSNDIGAGKKLYLKYNTRDEYLHSEVQNILAAYSGNISVVVRCLATGEALSPKVLVRDCKAIIIELTSLLGNENVAIV
jgi:DNA polymerase-3 subunit alpha